MELIAYWYIVQQSACALLDRRSRSKGIFQNREDWRNAADREYFESLTDYKLQIIWTSVLRKAINKKLRGYRAMPQLFASV